MYRSDDSIWGARKRRKDEKVPDESERIYRSREALFYPFSILINFSVRHKNSVACIWIRVTSCGMLSGSTFFIFRARLSLRRRKEFKGLMLGFMILRLERFTLASSLSWWNLPRRAFNAFLIFQFVVRRMVEFEQIFKRKYSPWIHEE